MKPKKDIAEMANRLHEFHRADGRERLGRAIVRWIEDPLKPKSRTAGLRINPILVLLGSLTAMAAGTFLFFSLVRS